MLERPLCQFLSSREEVVVSHNDKYLIHSTVPVAETIANSKAFFDSNGQRPARIFAKPDRFSFPNQNLKAMGGSPSDNSTACVSKRKTPQHDKDALILFHGLEMEHASENDASCASSCGDSSVMLDRRDVKSVAFAEVQVREYAVTIGDHPCCTMGCPLSLDWEYNIEPPCSLDAYEAKRAPRRNRGELLTSCEERRRILSQDGGISDIEMRRAERKLHRARTCSAKLCEKMSESFFREV